MKELLKSVLLKPRQSPVFNVNDYKGDNPGFQYFYDLRDGQDDIALKIRGTLAHPVPFIILWSFLVDFPGGWHYCEAWSFCWPLSWLNETGQGSCFIGSLG